MKGEVMRREVHEHKRLVLLVVPLLAATILACGLAGCAGDGGVPNVVINDPPNRTEVTLGEATLIQSTATDTTGVTKIELWVDDALYASDISPAAQGESPLSVTLDWTPQTLGSHRIVGRAYNAAGNMGESASITLIVVSGPPELSPTPTRSATSPPSVTPTQPALTPTPTIELTTEPHTVVNVASDDVLNVRAGAGVTQRIVGTIAPYGMDIQVTGAGRRSGGAMWVPIRYGDTAGWVNSNYLARQLGSVDEEIAARAAQIIVAIKQQDLETLAGLVHPEKGVRFSPYTYVRTEDIVFSADQMGDFLADQVTYTWGWFDARGEPIEFTTRQYYDRFIYDVDFARPDVVGFNETIGMGNTINNIAEVYPQAVTIEYHFEGFDPEFAALDWRSLRLVLEEDEGAWYLVAVVHDEWTI